MKWLFVLLILCNAGLIVWSKYYRPPAPAEPVISVPRATGPGHVNRLLLLSEIDTSELRERPPAMPAAPLAPETNATTSAPASLSNTPNASVTSASGRDRPPGNCLSIGPLAEDFAIDPLIALIRELGGAAELRAGERRELARYWVYFPPLDDRPAALNRVRELRERGIDDIYIIARGDMANAISLGVYSRKQSLERRVTTLNAAGYQPAVLPRYRSQKASWLDIVLPAPQAPATERLAQDFPRLEITPIRCSASLKLPAPQPSPTIAAPAATETPFVPPDIP